MARSLRSAPGTPPLRGEADADRLLQHARPRYWPCSRTPNCAHRPGHDGACELRDCDTPECIHPFAHTSRCEMACQKTRGCCFRPGHGGECDVPKPGQTRTARAEERVAETMKAIGWTMQRWSRDKPEDEPPPEAGQMSLLEIAAAKSATKKRRGRREDAGPAILSPELRAACDAINAVPWVDPNRIIRPRDLHDAEKCRKCRPDAPCHMRQVQKRIEDAIKRGEGSSLIAHVAVLDAEMDEVFREHIRSCLAKYEAAEEAARLAANASMIDDEPEEQEPPPPPKPAPRAEELPEPYDAANDGDAAEPEPQPRDPGETEQGVRVGRFRAVRGGDGNVRWLPTTKGAP